MSLPILLLANIVKAAEDYGLKDMATKLGYSAGQSGNSGDVTMLGLIGAGIQVVLGLLGTIVLIMIIYNGFVWMTAAGDSDKIKKVKDSLMSLFAGLVIVLLSYAISNFVVDNLMSLNQ